MNLDELFTVSADGEIMTRREPVTYTPDPNDDGFVRPSFLYEAASTAAASPSLGAGTSTPFSTALPEAGPGFPQHWLYLGIGAMALLFVFQKAR